MRNMIAIILEEVDEEEEAEKWKTMRNLKPQNGS